MIDHVRMHSVVSGMHSVGHRDAFSGHRDALSGHRDALSLVIGMRGNRWSASERRWGTQRRITVPVSVVVRSCVWVRWWVGMVVRFICVIRVPVCARVRPCAPCVSRVCPGSPRCLFKSSQVKSIQKQQTTIRKPIECDPEASRGPAGEDGSGRRWRRGIHLEVTRHIC